MSLDDLVEGGIMKKAVFLSDLHAPYQDKETMKTVYKFLEYIMPDAIVLGGDIIDFYAVSKFDKDPRRAFKLQEEINEGKKILNKIRSICPNSKIYYLEGNHEERMGKYLKKHPELYGLDALKIESLLGLEELDIEYQRELLLKDELLLKHGNYVYKFNANKELDSEGISGVSGHKHATQSMSYTGRNGTLSWYSVGHLSDIEQIDWLRGTANWQQGLGLIYFDNRGFQVYCIEINNHEFIFDGNRFKP